MSEAVNGRLVSVKTKFHREAVRPGGINRSGANMSSARSVEALKAQVEDRLEASTEPLVALLRDWQAERAPQGCDWAGQVRDLAGLAGLHLLTEVAMHCFDCLDAVAIDGVVLKPTEAAVLADALAFARQDMCRGSDLEPYRSLLQDLTTLSNRVVARAEQDGVAR